MTKLTRTKQEQKLTKPKENMKPGEITVRSTKRQIRPATTSSWKQWMRHDTRSSRTQIHFIQISRRSKSLTISQNFFRTSYSRFWRYSPRNKNALHRCQWNPTVNKCDGSSAAKIQAGKTRHTGRVYARCGAEISTTFR